jgi:hypothetical protein
VKAGKAIYNILTNTSAVTSYVSTRISPLKANNLAQFPYVVYEQVSLVPTIDKDGPSKLDIIRVQINILHNNYDTLSNVADAIRTALERKAAGTYGGVNVQSIVFDNEGEMYNDNVDLDGIYGWQQDYILRIKN